MTNQRPQTGAEIRQSFIEYFTGKGHTFVPSSSVVPGGDATLLFTNAGMVQFKDVFLGTDHRPYTRAVNSQKCMRVAGKHNDLDDVGRDDSHHTFFEMLGNWSFGDYYKKEAITWAWDLLTNVWGLDRSKLWATVFKDDKGSIPSDEEAYQNWIAQPGMQPDHVLYFGRKDNFWEMAETGPCGPCSEIHIDLGPETCNKKGVEGHICGVNGDCKRFLELWNLVFIQYNRMNATDLQPLPACHVDTGMGLERVVAVIQHVSSNYRTDLLSPMMDTVQRLTGHSLAERETNITPYRVIADHSRSAAFLIADGVVPGNTGRSYVCRMIIRRAARFGNKIGLNQPFLAEVAGVVIDRFGDFYPELKRNRQAILNNLTQEEIRFARTVEAGLSHLEELLEVVKKAQNGTMDGKTAFDLYATHGLPLELTRDIAREQNLDVDETGFRQAMDEHRLASGAGKAFGQMSGENVETYRAVLTELVSQKKLGNAGVEYDPYLELEASGEVLALMREGELVTDVLAGDRVEVILPKAVFYIESGGQVADSGWITGQGEDDWEIEVENVAKPAAGVIVHNGVVRRGRPRVGDAALARVDGLRRSDIRRNHTATHLLHSQLRRVLGDHVRQAGSLVAPDRLRFDFNQPEGLTPEQIEKIEEGVNREIYENHPLTIETRTLSEAIHDGATALFGEKYGEVVRTISIGSKERFSYELCGGTHVEQTGDIGIFIITSEGSAAAGVRRIEAVTGRGAYELIQGRMRKMKQAASLLGSGLDDLPGRAKQVLDELAGTQKQIHHLRQEMVAGEFERALAKVGRIANVPVLAAVLNQADADTLRQMTDRFRQKYPSGVIVLGSAVDERPVLVAAVTDDLVKRGLHAGEIVKTISQVIGGSGGGRPNMAQAGGKDPGKLKEAVGLVAGLVAKKLG